MWSSNRTGNHELYLLDLRTRAVRRLTNTPQVEFFSRFSPDGRRILFTRSQRDYVSPRDPTAWDVYVMNVDGTGERLLARNGYSPQWAPGGDAIIFLRGDQVIRLDLDGAGAGRESVLLDGPTTAGIEGGMETPELSPDGARLAVTVRSQPVRRRGGRRPRHAGRHPAVPGPGLPDHLGAGLGRAPVDGDPGERRHPDRGRRARPAPRRVHGPAGHRTATSTSRGSRNDGRWLVWGAAASGHEHDRADYEIFVWQIGRPVSEAVRLTHHPGNDQWPDLYVPR